MARTSRRRLSIEGSCTIKLNGRDVSYLIKRSSKAKRVRLEINRGEGLVAVLPRSFPRNEVAAILAVREAWICRHLDAYAAMRPAPLLNNLEHGAQIPYLGMSITLVCNGKTGAKEAYYSGGNLIVHQGCGNGTLGNVIERWYREQAVDMLERKTGHYGSLMGLSFGRISIRGQRTIWGSCSRKGRLSFNWKLLMAPEPVIDYVVVHELAHIREMNHGCSFWSLVAAYCPGWRQHRKWLHEHASLLAAR